MGANKDSFDSWRHDLQGRVEAALLPLFPHLNEPPQIPLWESHPPGERRFLVLARDPLHRLIHLDLTPRHLDVWCGVFTADAKRDILLDLLSDNFCAAYKVGAVSDPERPGVVIVHVARTLALDDALLRLPHLIEGCLDAALALAARWRDASQGALR